jgi:MFS family permease
MNLSKLIIGKPSQPFDCTMGIDAEACATGLLVALDAAMCLGVGAMLTELAAEFGTGESYAAALVATPFYAGRLVATLMVPDALSRHGRRSVLGTGALALAVSAAWFSRAASLEECAFARLACGLAAGPAPIAALSLPARRLSATGAPLALQLVTLSAVVGALGAQAPLQLAVRVLGWRRATLLGCALPALVVALGAAIFRDEPPASGRNPLLLRWPSRRARSDSNTSFTMGLGDAARRSFDESPACCIPRALLPASSEPHLRLFAASCGAAHALLDSLGGPLGLLAMQRGLAPYGARERRPRACAWPPARPALTCDAPPRAPACPHLRTHAYPAPPTHAPHTCTRRLVSGRGHLGDEHGSGGGARRARLLRAADARAHS